MSFCLRPNVCKKCGKPLTLFEGWTCLECEKAEQEPILDKIRAEIEETIESYVCDKEENTMKAQGMLNAMQMTFEIIDKYMKEQTE